MSGIVYNLGWNDREKEGLPRLVEALESHMWSTMQKIGLGSGCNSLHVGERQPKHEEGSSAQYEGEVGLVSGGVHGPEPLVEGREGEVFGGEVVGQTLQGSRESIPITDGDLNKQMNNVNDSAFKFSDSFSSETLNSGVCADGHSIESSIESVATASTIHPETTKISKPTSIEKAKPVPVDSDDASRRTSGITVLEDFMERESADEDEIDEAVWGNLTSVLAQAKLLRNEATTGAVSDNERRDRAAKLALSLATMINIDESDSESSDDT